MFENVFTVFYLFFRILQNVCKVLMKIWTSWENCRRFSSEWRSDCFLFLFLFLCEYVLYESARGYRWTHRLPHLYKLFFILTIRFYLILLLFAVQFSFPRARTRRLAPSLLRFPGVRHFSSACLVNRCALIGDWMPVTCGDFNRRCHSEETACWTFSGFVQSRFFFLLSVLRLWCHPDVWRL